MDFNIQKKLRPNSQIRHRLRIAASVVNLTGVIYTPSSYASLDYPDDEDVLVMTSGNPSGAPICMNDEEVIISIADAISYFPNLRYG